MSEQQFDTFEDFVREFDKSAERKEKYREQKPYFDLIREIVDLRRIAGLTQEELAERAGVSQSRISRIEAGEHDIQLSTLIKLAAALGASVDLRLVQVNEMGETAWKKIVQSVPADMEPTSIDYTESETQDDKPRIEARV